MSFFVVDFVRCQNEVFYWHLHDCNILKVAAEQHFSIKCMLSYSEELLEQRLAVDLYTRRTAIHFFFLSGLKTTLTFKAKSN